MNSILLFGFALVIFYYRRLWLKERALHRCWFAAMEATVLLERTAMALEKADTIEGGPTPLPADTCECTHPGSEHVDGVCYHVVNNESALKPYCSCMKFVALSEKSYGKVSVVDTTSDADMAFELDFTFSDAAELEINGVKYIPASKQPISIEEANELQDILCTITNSGTALKTSARELVAIYNKAKEDKSLSQWNKHIAADS